MDIHKSKNTKSLLDKLGMLFVNQGNVQIKLTEMWKAVHINGNPHNVKEVSKPEGSMITRSNGSHRPIQHGGYSLSSGAFINRQSLIFFSYS